MKRALFGRENASVQPLQSALSAAYPSWSVN